MPQNRSTAVMQRRVEPHDSLDDFCTPPWATRAVCEWLRDRGQLLQTMDVREPCANRGYMVRPLREYFDTVMAADVHDYGCGFPQRDYLFGPSSDFLKTDWTFMNPPFRLAAQFIERALEISKIGVACIVRSAFLEGQERFETLYRDTPPWAVLIHTERVAMVKGRYDPKASTATSYAWLIWRNDLAPSGPPRLDWLAPCRRLLERADDVQIFI
jgi:hypothetical protein